MDLSFSLKKVRSKNSSIYIYIFAIYSGSQKEIDPLSSIALSVYYSVLHVNMSPVPQINRLVNPGQ